MKILYVGESWKGSAARSLREAVERLSEDHVGEVGEDQFVPRYRTLIPRIGNRVLKRWQKAELEQEIRGKIDVLEPEVLLVYKGEWVSASLIRETSSRGILTVNVFPDYSPHAFGSGLAEAMGCYDLVVSTKPFHPESWRPIYGYSNKCVFVAHGYDPSIHYWSGPAESHDFDVVLAAFWRPEYGELLEEFHRAVRGDDLTVAVAGPGWISRWPKRPKGWEFHDGIFGRAYGSFVRRGRMVIAPVHRRVVVDGKRQPGDVDTMRTYELAAAHTFFLHKRSDYLRTVYDEETEVPMWESAEELADLVRHYRGRDAERREAAARAHARAVPAYSIDSRARGVLRYIEAEMSSRSG